MDLGSGLGSSHGASTGRAAGGHNSSLTRPGSGSPKALSRQNSDERPSGGGGVGGKGGGGGGAGNSSQRTSPNGGSSLRPATTGGAGRSKNLGGSLPIPSNDHSMSPVPYGAATGMIPRLADPTVLRCRLTVSKLVLKAPMVSAISA